MKYVRRRFKPHDGRLISRMPHTIHIIDDERFHFYGVGAVIRNDINEWINENIGEYLKEWAVGTGYKNKMVFFFTSKDKAFAFKLRWS